MTDNNLHEEVSEPKREFTITVKRPSLGRSALVILSVGVIVIVAGLVGAEILRGAAPAPHSSVNPTPSSSPTPSSTPKVEPAPTRKPVLPPMTSVKTFVMPELVGLDAITAANTVLSMAPGAHLQFIDQSGHTVESKSSQIVTSSNPNSGQSGSTTDSIVVFVKN